MIYNFTFVFLLILGFYAVVLGKSLIKMVIGLNIMEAAVFLWVISIADNGGMIPIFQSLPGLKPVNDPIPQALILTGIIIGASTTALLLTLVIELKKLAGNINPEELEGLAE